MENKNTTGRPQTLEDMQPNGRVTQKDLYELQLTVYDRTDNKLTKLLESQNEMNIKLEKALMQIDDNTQEIDRLRGQNILYSVVAAIVGVISGLFGIKP